MTSELNLIIHQILNDYQIKRILNCKPAKSADSRTFHKMNTIILAQIYI